MTNSGQGLKRRAFLKTGLTGAAGLIAGSSVLQGQEGRAPSKKDRKTITRTLGKTGIKLPVISMGVMNSDNPDLVRAALDSGIVHLDTAHGYMRGRNEVMIGGVLKGRPRDSFVIATKVPASDPGAFLEMFDLSLKRLSLDYVEILYLHNITTRRDALSATMLKALEAVKKSGKARFIGMSVHTNEPEVIRAAVESKTYDVVLTSYNFQQGHSREVRRAIAEAAAAGLGIVAMKTLAGAFWDKEKQQPINAKAALKWVLSDPNVCTAIPGMTTFDQLESNLSVMESLALTSQEKKDLRLGNGESVGLYCQGCGQCLAGCPKELPIPSLMRSYMYAYGYKNLQAAHELVTSLDLPETLCGDCGVCSALCAKGFDVSDRVRDIARLRTVPSDFFA